jgi:hypothetical protein
MSLKTQHGRIGLYIMVSRTFRFEIRYRFTCELSTTEVRVSVLCDYLGHLFPDSCCRTIGGVYMPKFLHKQQKASSLKLFHLTKDPTWKDRFDDYFRP